MPKDSEILVLVLPFIGRDARQIVSQIIDNRKDIDRINRVQSELMRDLRGMSTGHYEALKAEVVDIAPKLHTLKS